ncbi:hypothetical protein ES692_04120 [Psychroserpens burtonensis]|uniref:Lipoprotein n=1 Tax=Psychroserpens burtonensis TaxID=49278 RepID=A0A5C7BCF4_9FLAO|nr:hypothetical protein [Psychroserpens burtonensis]TXE19051.1 hypothetical protein ES692_04120 [Psychroserpens burtonensis]
MNKILSIVVLMILSFSCSSTKFENSDFKYFDENNIQISKSKFNRIRSTNKLLDIPGDSSNHKKLTLRVKKEQLQDKSLLVTILENETNIKIDSTKPIVIIYYPGKDPCNSSGTVNQELRKFWFWELEKGLEQIAETKPIYIYKDHEGIEKSRGFLDWNKDPDNVIEKLFFKHHYPCSSFVVISKDGEYISRFGEFGKRTCLGNNRNDD